MEKLKKNWYLILIALATVILGVIAVVTTIKLYQIGEEPVAPTAPKPAPAAAPECELTFNVSEPTLTPTPTPTLPLDVTPTPTPTPTPPPGATPTPTLPPGVTPTLTPTPTPVTLEIAGQPPGFTLSTIGAIFGGVFLIITGLLIVL